MSYSPKKESEECEKEEGLKKRYGYSFCAKGGVVNAIPRARDSAAAAACEDTADASDRVSKDYGAGGNIGNKEETAEAELFLVEKVTDSEIHNKERKCAADEAAVECETGRDLKRAGGEIIVKCLQKHSGGVTACDGNNAGVNAKIVYAHLKTYLVAYDAEGEDGGTKRKEKKERIKIKSGKYIVWVHNFSVLLGFYALYHTAKRRILQVPRTRNLRPRRYRLAPIVRLCEHSRLYCSVLTLRVFSHFCPRRKQEIRLRRTSKAEAGDSATLISKSGVCFGLLAKIVCKPNANSITPCLVITMR